MNANVPAARVKGLLGIGSERKLSLIDHMERGLPVAALERLTAMVAPADSGFKFRIVPRATLARRGKAGLLTPGESGTVLRLARLWSQAQELWREPDEARAFLFGPHPLLGRRRPIDLAIATDLGSETVSALLGRLKHGTAL